MNTKELLKKVFLFDDFSDDQLELLSSFTALKKLGRNDLLFSEGEKAAAFFYVLEGKLKVFKISPDGQEHTFAIQNAGDLVAEAAIFDKETYPAYCQALSNSILMRIPKHDFIDLVMRHPEVGLKMMNAYAKRLRQFVVMVEELSLRDIKARLARYIVENMQNVDGKKICKINITKKELANVLGTIPESLSRTIRYFKKENIITEEKRLIEVIDLKKLKSLL